MKNDEQDTANGVEKAKQQDGWYLKKFQNRS